MSTKFRSLVGGLLAVVFVLGPAASTSAQWAVTFESIMAPECGTVEFKLNLTLQKPLTQLVVPVIVRQLDPGSYWTGTLPVDTAGGTAVGVSWNWSNPGWANVVQEIRPGIPTTPCVTGGDAGYDGISPDHFLINVIGSGTSTPAEPSGRDVLTLTFQVSHTPGDFEFDTACFAGAMSTIRMVDNQTPAVDHGPSGTGEVVFTEGYVSILPGMCPDPIGTYIIPLVTGQATDNLVNTHNGVYADAEGDPARFYRISGPGTVDEYTGEWTWTPDCGEYGDYHVDVEVTDGHHASCGGPGTCPLNRIGFDVSVDPGCCFCGDLWGDYNCDGEINPLDVVDQVLCVYKNFCEPCYPEGWHCPNPIGDVNCDGLYNPVDVVYYVNYVYKNWQFLCHNPCDE